MNEYVYLDTKIILNNIYYLLYLYTFIKLSFIFHLLYTFIK